MPTATSNPATEKAVKFVEKIRKRVATVVVGQDVVVERTLISVSYTHLTLPTILLV